MVSLDDIVERLIDGFIEEYFSYEKTIALIMFRKFVELKVIPEDLQFSEFEKYLRITFDDAQIPVSIQLDDEALGIKTEYPPLETIELASKDFEDLGDIIEHSLEDFIENVIQELAKKMVKAWKEEAPRLLQKERQAFSEFQQYLQETWGEVLKLLEILLSTILDKGVEVDEIYHKSVDPGNAAVILVMRYLFGRACQVGREIHVLLSNGFADGAEARWRTLHEIVVTATFIMGNDNETAIRYIAHETIDTYKTMKQYTDRWESEGLKIVTDEQLEEIGQKRDLLLTLYGKSFDSDYGWAASALGKTEKQKTSFSDLESAVGHDYLRPMYKESNSNIHASSRGTSIRLGLPNDSDLILAGHSVFGIGEIARNSSFSMLIFIENMLMAYPNLENRIFTEAIYKLFDQIHEAFLVAEKSLNETTTTNTN